jgi:hypothetical protein
MVGVALLASCGGGGGGDPSPAPPPVQPPADPVSVCGTAGAAYSVFASTSVAAGKNAAATLAGCTGTIAAPQWTQTTGPAVALLSDKTQTISFEAPQAGAYGFSVSFRDPGGTPRTESVSIEATAAAAPLITLRASQSVRMGGNVSVRAWPQLPSGETVQSITWTQLEGPAATLDQRDPYVLLFRAPVVARDTVIRLRATLRTASGLTDTDDALVLVEKYDQAAESDREAIWGGSHVSRVYAYKPASPYAGVLSRCVYDASLRYLGTNANMCSLSTLPFLAQETGGAIPTVEQVMNRVVVSHDWAGKNFEDFLRTQDTQGDFRRLMNSVTAVVIGAQVRPSFYYALTGAIYLDGDNFWLTPAERDTVNEAPDFRSDFARDLNYGGLWRYVQNNRNIFVFFDPRSRTTRALDYLLNESGWLMYHELGHAVDFMPPSQYASLSGTDTAWGVIGPRFAAKQLISDLVSQQYPLTSSAMSGLAQVKFQGATASPAQIAYTPDQVAGFFSADIGTDEYSYSTTREDVALLMEEFLMAHRLGILRDKAITDKIGAGATGSTILVRWGQRGRIGEASIKPRAKSAVQQMAPWVDANAVDALPAPTAMRAGESWTANLTQPAIPRVQKPTDAEPTLMEMWQFEKELQRMQHHGHTDAWQQRVEQRLKR